MKQMAEEDKTLMISDGERARERSAERQRAERKQQERCPAGDGYLGAGKREVFV